MLLFLAFLGLTLVMTWPWVKHLRDTVSDPGDPYFTSWLLWWDYHQTFHDPLNLFHANIFYPYQYTLAFSENIYGIALLFFPLFALGLRPLTVNGIATLIGFALSGYGTFRLARTLTNSNSVAWVAGIIFAFIPYRFAQLPHLPYLFAGWIPLLLEALVLFARKRSWGRAAWLGIAFLMNALSSIHWFVLTLIPLGLSAGFLLARYRIERDRAFWLRGSVALGAAGVVLLPFLLPYLRAAELYGFVRSVTEAMSFSARPVHWLVADGRNKLWQGFNASAAEAEKLLFPGLLPILLALVSLLLVRPAANLDRNPVAQDATAPSRTLLVSLDVLALVAALIALLAAGPDGLRVRLFGWEILQAHSTHRALAVFVIVFFVRCCLAYPEFLRVSGRTNFIATLRSTRRSEIFWIGLIWTVTGFFGSLGMNFFFHRVLYDFVALFRSIRVPARWSMICYLGLALLAGLGASCCAERLARLHHRLNTAAILTFIIVALLFEQRAAPLTLFRGQADPTALTLRLKETPMAGGIVELPADLGCMTLCGYVLRAADHGRPLVTAFSGFEPPIIKEIAALTKARPINADRFLELLENIPCSYLIIHNALLSSETRSALEPMLVKGINAGRLRFINSYGDAEQPDELYAITKTEPQAQTKAPRPAPPPINDAEFFVRLHYADFLGREPDPGGVTYWTSQITGCGDDVSCIDERRVSVSAAFFFEKEFQETGYFIYRLYKGTLGRQPSYTEFMRDRQRVVEGENLAALKAAFAENWVQHPEFLSKYPSHMKSEEFVEALLRTAQDTSGVDLSHQRLSLVNLLNAGATRGAIVRQVVEDKTFANAERNNAFVLMGYFGYLRRDPRPEEYKFWADLLNNQASSDYRAMVRAFITAKEYRARFKQ